uniref:TPR_REGION domain-containing protein n=1 Tax=Angiostrongylus cantonensis TaxID=6313 RepID=A0A0K0CZP5_ANGCA
MAIEHNRNSLQTALDAYVIMADQLQQNPNTQAKEELQRTINMMVEQAVEHLDKAERYLFELIDLGKTLEVTETKPLKDSNVYPPVINLPPISIPKFNKDIKEWKAFWKAFNYNAYSRQMEYLQKMSCLIDALQGEARECVKQYQISQGAYPVVVQHLKDKYDNKQALVRYLLRRLCRTKARTKRLED